jgi:hypothetical protein
LLSIVRDQEAQEEYNTTKVGNVNGNVIDKIDQERVDATIEGQVGAKSLCQVPGRVPMAGRDKALPGV